MSIIIIDSYSIGSIVELTIKILIRIRVVRGRLVVSSINRNSSWSNSISTYHGNSDSSGTYSYSES